MVLLDYSFVKKGEILQLVGDLTNGWRKATKTYCFSEATTIESGLGKWLGATLQLFPRPGGFSSIHSQPPLPLKHSFTRDWMSGTITQSGIVVLVPWRVGEKPLSEDTKWKKDRQGKPFIQTQLDVIPAAHDSGSSPAEHIGHFQLQLRLVIEPLNHAPPVVRDYFKRFFPGGLPSLGKRA